MSLLALPLELLLEVATHLELGAYVALSSSSRFFYEILQGEKLAWLVMNMPKRKRDRPTEAAAVLKGANAMVLGQALRYIVEVHGTRRPVTQELLAAGASFARVGCGEFLEQEFRANGASFKIKFAVAHGASMRSVSCGPAALLGEMVENHFRDVRTAWLLQHISLHEIPGGIDQYMARIVNRSGATRRTQFLISQGAEPPDKAEYMEKLYRAWGAGSTVFRQFTRGGYPLSEARMGELLLWAVNTVSPETSVRAILEQGASWSMVPGGINAVLEKTIYETEWLRESQIALLISHGASLDHLPNGLPVMLNYLLDNQNSYPHKVALLLEQGVSLDSVPNGWGKHLRSTFLQSGPGPALDRIIQHFGIPFDRVEGGLQGVLAAVLSRRYFNRDRVDYLVQRGADPAGLPEINSALENVIRHCRSFGPWRESCEFLLSYGADFKEIPSGLNKLLEEKFQDIWWFEDVCMYLVRQGADPQGLWDDVQQGRLNILGHSHSRLKWLDRQRQCGNSER